MVRLRTQVILFVVLALLVVTGSSVREHSSYCRLCGKLRESLVLTPMGLGESERTVWAEEAATPLSAVLEPLFAPQRHVHVWVRSSSRPAIEYIFPFFAGGGHAYRKQQTYMGTYSYYFAYVAPKDPELALKAAEVFLFPYSSWRDMQQRTEPLLKSGFGLMPLSDENLGKWRTLCGLPPRAGQGRRSAPAANGAAGDPGS